MWWSKSHFKPAGKLALIIGASQGLGADIAFRLYEQGCSVILVARTEAKLEKQVERIVNNGDKSSEHGLAPTCEYLACDAANYDATAELWKVLVQEKNVDPDYIFCCAGSSVPKLFEDLTGRDIALGMDVNYFSAVNVIHCGIKATAGKKKPRHIILFSSTVASYPFIGYIQYGPTKAAISTFSMILRQELRHKDYRVSCVFPGSFSSEGYEEEERTKPKITKQIEGASPAIPSMDCCDFILDKLAKGYDAIYTDMIGWLLGCMVLCVQPRCWSVLQVIVALFLSAFAPLINWFVNQDVKKFFQAQEQTEPEPIASDDHTSEALSK
ncbi:hypothetical protein FT663_02712 [Candidozyma haemuli var. vulneris]|uniref:3-ketodihydrosphingosine reductase TSC10 n=1 Tax=Candidozyma haemuli TaxID=45357 RepID=A0A2V1AQ81_9ASCO|nr:hypothetical protein CXQ85_001417 [[Candida] haemuloni]KAF3989619.1 hypothetical protein FT662_02698 [[Candida] haemuloni var. vulneris]KAF3991414.1 hypothetical protein FT663_02712 [[Candida] haemuloni var. vulneris]PVH19121.1 hypothetical protein CXQ85_001417 [[Candida] haemuloni]